MSRSRWRAKRWWSTSARANAELADLVRERSVGVGTPVCVDINEARDKLLRVRDQMLELAQAGGFRLAGAGTHPFSRWEGREETLAQYRQMAEDAQMVARRLLAFGLRIHIGVEDRDLAVDVMNTMRYVLPHILCLSTSSPFWHGRNTGLKSYRAVLMDALPRTGIPGYFSSATRTTAAMSTRWCAPTPSPMRAASCTTSCRTIASPRW